MRAWEKNVRMVEPYVPGEQPDAADAIKLNTNENPYPPAPGVARILKELPADSLRLYPDCTAFELVKALADYHGLSPEQVFVGVGSDDVLAMAFLTFFNAEKSILFPDVTYSFYEVWANLLGISYEQPALDENFRIIPEDYFRENGGIVFPNPNAPSGLALSLSQIERILEHNRDVVVVIDEAYVDFGGESAVPLIEKYDNLLVTRTFSKSRALAGMRIGYGMGSPELIRHMNNTKYSYNPYTMDRTALAVGVESVKDEEYFREVLHRLIQVREWTKEKFRKLGFQFQDSQCNFLFVKHEKYSAPEILEALREKHIYVRHFKGSRVEEYLRITIGTREQMERLVEVLTEYLNQ